MKRFLFFLGITIAVYYLVLPLGFAQDDYFFLLLSKVDSLPDFLSFFSPWHQAGFPFYRPLGTQTYFYIFRSLFGLAQAPFFMHLFMLTLHAVNGAQIYRLFRHLRFSPFKSTLASLLYLTSSIHFLSLVYIAATQHLLATTFSLAGLNALLTRRPRRAALALALALLSKESAIVTLPAMALIMYWQNSFTFKNLRVKLLIYPLLTTLAYLALRLAAGITVQSEYHFLLDLRVFTTLRFYAMYLLGYFEKIPDYPLPSALPQFFHDTSPFGIVTYYASLVTLGITSLSLLASLSRARQLGVSILLMLIGLVLYLGFPTHLFPHYLDYTLLGFLLLVLSLRLSRPILLLLCALLIAGNLSGIYASFRLHWSPLRSELNSKLVPRLVERGLCEHTDTVLTGDPVLVSDLFYALGDDNGPSVICNQPVKLYYTGHEELPPQLPTIEIGYQDL